MADLSERHEVPSTSKVVPVITYSSSLSSKDEIRLFAGLAVQPFVGAALAFLSFPLVDYSGRALYGGFPADTVDAAISFAFGVSIVALFVTVCGALPIVLYLLKRGPLTLKEVLVGGAALGNAPFILVVAGIVASQVARGTMSSEVGHLWYGLPGAIRSTAISSFIGLGSAAVFWVVAGRRILHAHGRGVPRQTCGVQTNHR
jgi:hypothetical protein